MEILLQAYFCRFSLYSVLHSGRSVDILFRVIFKWDLVWLSWITFLFVYFFLLLCLFLPFFHAFFLSALLCFSYLYLFHPFLLSSAPLCLPPSLSFSPLLGCWMDVIYRALLQTGKRQKRDVGSDGAWPAVIVSVCVPLTELRGQASGAVPWGLFSSAVRLSPELKLRVQSEPAYCSLCSRRGEQRETDAGGMIQ